MVGERGLPLDTGISASGILISGGATVITNDCGCSDGCSNVWCDCESGCDSVGVEREEWAAFTGVGVRSTGEGDLGAEVTSRRDRWRLWVEGGSRRAGADALERIEEGGVRF